MYNRTVTYLIPEDRREVIRFANYPGIDLTAEQVQDLLNFIDEMMSYHDGVSLPLRDYYHMWQESYE